MVNIKCELCGSNNFQKDGDFFICEHCGCKYSVEQAKKLIIDGTVQVEGKVEINTSEKIKNLYVIARRSRDNNDWDSAKRYYDLVLQEDPQSWEAIFYLAYFDAYYCKNGELQIKASKMCNCITSVVDLIILSNMSLKEKEESLTMIGSSVISISNGLQERAKNFRNSMIGIKFISPTMLLSAGKDQQTYYNTVVPMINCKYFFADGIEKGIEQFEEYPNVKQLMVKMWKLGNSDLEELFKNRLTDHNKNVIQTYKTKISKYSSDQPLDFENTDISESQNENEVPQGPSKAGKVFSTLSLILGIAFAFLSFVIMCVAMDTYEAGAAGFVFGIYAVAPLVFGFIGKKKSDGSNGKAVVGIILSFIAIFCGIVSLILAVS